MRPQRTRVPLSKLLIVLLCVNLLALLCIDNERWKDVWISLHLSYFSMDFLRSLA